MKPILSLCIPTYNRAPLLRDALQQIKDQWLDQFDRRVEIVVSDNGSTDETPQVLHDMVLIFPPETLRVYRARENQGPDANIYRVASLALGEFVYILSDDDLLLPGALQKLFSLIEAHPTFDAFCLNIRSFKDSVEEAMPVWFPVVEDTILRDRDQALALLKPLFLSTLAYRRALVADKDYSIRIGTNWVQSYLFLDVMANQNGIFVTAEPFLAQRQENTEGWHFFPVMTTNFRDWLKEAERIGYSPVTITAVLAKHLRTQIWTAVLNFKLTVNPSKLAPKPAAYQDAMKRMWKVYGPDPFLLFVLFPIMLTPARVLQHAHHFYRVLRPHPSKMQS